ncbi:hypothetical protein ACSBR2_033301 [Camellia fascicularis]
MVTFSKRRHGLFNKARQLRSLTGADIAILTFSPAGRPYTHGEPSFDDLVDRYLNTAAAGEKAEEGCEAAAANHHRLSSWLDALQFDASDSIEDLEILKKGLEEIAAKVAEKIDDLPHLRSIRTVSGEVPEDPVVSNKLGLLFEKRLIERHISEYGKCPITGEALSMDDVVPIKPGKIVKPRPVQAASIPGMLGMFQIGWDSLMLSNFALEQQLHTARQELSHALYRVLKTSFSFTFFFGQVLDDELISSLKFGSFVRIV